MPVAVTVRCLPFCCATLLGNPPTWPGGCRFPVLCRICVAYFKAMEAEEQGPGGGGARARMEMGLMWVGWMFDLWLDAVGQETTAPRWVAGATVQRLSGSATTTVLHHHWLTALGRFLCVLVGRLWCSSRTANAAGASFGHQSWKAVLKLKWKR